MKGVVAIALITVCSTNALGGDAVSGALSSVHFMPDGGVIAYTDGTRSGVPSCAATQPSGFAIDGTTPAGKVQASDLLTAYAAGKSVTITDQ